MRYRKLGRSGIDVSVCTLGTSGLLKWDRAETGKTWASAFERGVNAIEVDAAAGTAEPIARILAEQHARARVHVLARIRPLVPFDPPSPHVPADQAFPGAHIRAESEALLRALGVDRLGLLMLPSWCAEWWDEGDWLPTLASLKSEGKIAGFGVSLFDHDVEAALGGVAAGMIDAVQVMYNIFDQRAALALMPLCLGQGVGVIARSPLYYGMLVARADRPAAFPVDDWRSEFFFDAHLDETSLRADQLEKLAEQSGTSLADLALRFSFSHPAVSTVAVGIGRRAHFDAYLAALERGSLDGDTMRALSPHEWLC